MTKPRALKTYTQDICESAYAKLPGHGYKSFEYIRSKGTKTMLLNFTAAVLKVLEELEATDAELQLRLGPVLEAADEVVDTGYGGTSKLRAALEQFWVVITRQNREKAERDLAEAIREEKEAQDDYRKESNRGQ